MRAAFAIAPAVIDSMSAVGVEKIGIPIRIVVGESDENAPAEANARILALHAPKAELRILEDVGHYTFLSQWGWPGSDLCEERSGVSRATMHAELPRTRTPSSSARCLEGTDESAPTRHHEPAYNPRFETSKAWVNPLGPAAALVRAIAPRRSEIPTRAGMRE